MEHMERKVLEWEKKQYEGIMSVYLYYNITLKLWAIIYDQTIIECFRSGHTVLYCETKLLL